jgi:2-polyprenyl-3-methyl-5-hydroxy-6-metoxy-1,4-benzoquinol methylase
VRRLIAARTAEVVRTWRGRVLDVGCGDKPYRSLAPGVNDWLGVDAVAGPQVDIVCYAERLPFGDGVFDHVILSQVIEHVTDPVAVLSESRRVLKSDGTVFVSAPQAWPVHGAPHDYYRFTAFGLTHVLHAAGFRDVDSRSYGGSLATVVLFVLLAFPLLRLLASATKSPFATAILALDRRFSPAGANALGNIATGRRR